MASSAAVLEDDSRLSRIDRGLERIERNLALLGGFAVFVMMLFAVVSVTGRNVFNKPIAGYIDWIIELMPLIAFLGISWAQRDGTHVRMDIVVGKLKGRALWAAEFATVFVTLIVMLLLVWGSWAHFARSFDFGSPLWSRDSTIDIGLPLWPAKLLAPLSFGLLCIRLMVQICGFANAFRYNLDKPVAVPLIRDAAQQAAEEAELLLSDDDGTGEAK